jgi:hypothetical protein
MKLRMLAAAAAVLSVALAASEASALLLYDGGAGHLTNPTNQTSFENFTQLVNSANQAYVEDGISVTYVSASGQGQVVSWQPRTGDDAWNAVGPGEYTVIRMTNGSLMDEIQWQSRSANSQDVIYYQALRNGQLVQLGNHFSGIGGPYRNFGIQAGPSEHFDELRLVVTSGTPFASNQFQAFTMDDLAVSALNPPSPTPEPSLWAVMILGFGATGIAVRRQRRRYRLVEKQRNGQPVSEEFTAPDDETAVARARRVATAGQLQVWCGRRLVAG